MNPNTLQRIQKLLLPVFTIVYSVIGIIYFKWSVFHIVYLFWFENFIRILFFGIRAYSVDYVSLNSYTLPARSDEGKLIQPLKSVFFSRLFFYAIYFVFIIVGLGFILPFGENSVESTADALISFMKVFTFSDMEFNIALLSCVLDELVNYIKDFKIQKINTKKAPLIVLRIIEKEDIVLHLTIILSAAFIFLHKQENMSPFFNLFGPNLSMYAVPGVILAVLIFAFQIYTILKVKDKQN